VGEERGRTVLCCNSTEYVLVVTTCVVAWVGLRRLSMVGVVVVSVASSSERGIVVLGLS